MNIMNGIEGSTILLVEDNTALLRNVAFILEVAGFEVLTAHDGAEALQVLKQRSPDIIVSDLNMPEVDGAQLLQTVRADSRWSCIPFIMVSARYGYDDLMHVLDLGADEFLPKPFDAFELIDAVHITLAETPHLRRIAG